MPSETNPPDAIHFRSIRLENVRAFGSSQTLELFDEEGAISHWNLILGENGVGKTTLMQALAVMRPVPVPEDKAAIDADPKLSAAEFAEFENDQIMHFMRRDGTGPTTVAAVLETDQGKTLEVGVEIRGSTKELDSVKFKEFPHELRSGGPLVIFYSAGRHVGHRNQATVSKRNATESLFLDAIDLYDAEEIIEELDYAAKSDPNGENGDARQRDILKTAVAGLLPDLTAAQIEINGPRVEGRDQSGVLVQTPSGKTPLADLSLGYQTMFALTVDLAWRLFKAFPDSPDPLSESAIVLIDEVDLHLHPRWQRDLAKRLLSHFPKVQFIATTHNPVTAQEALAVGGTGTLAVVRWVDGEAHILNHPIPKREWRSDQLLESELFEFGADRNKETEAKIYKRIELSRMPIRSPEQDEELRKLDEFVASLPTAPSPAIQSFEDLMIEMAKDYRGGLVR